MKIECVEVGIIKTNCYIVEGDCRDERFVMIIDPGDDADKIVERVLQNTVNLQSAVNSESVANSRGANSQNFENLQSGARSQNVELSRGNAAEFSQNAARPQHIASQISTAGSRSVTHIVLTHAHFDHIGAVSALHKTFPNAKICVGEHEKTDAKTIEAVMRKALGAYYSKMPFPKESFNIPKPDVLLKDNNDFLCFKVLHTPGHTSGSICLYSEENHVLFCGDTLFCNGYGRTDLFGSDEDMAKSLKKLMQLDGATVVYAGHGAPTTIELARNIGI